MTNPPKRHEDDYYPTPAYVTRDFLRVFARTMRGVRRILEPAAGDGAMVHELRERWPQAHIDAYDITPRGEGIEQRIFWADDEPGTPLYDLMMTNPPFEWAEGFAAYGLTKLAPGGALVMWLPDGFLHSKKRRAWLRAHMPHHTYIVPERPSFSGDGKTDPRNYIWCVWRNNGGRKYTPRLSIL